MNYEEFKIGLRRLEETACQEKDDIRRLVKELGRSTMIRRIGEAFEIYI